MLFSHRFWFVVFVFQTTYYFIPPVESSPFWGDYPDTQPNPGDGSPVDPQNQAGNADCGGGKNVPIDAGFIAVSGGTYTKTCIWNLEVNWNQYQSLQVSGVCIAEIKCILYACNLTASTNKNCNSEPKHIYLVPAHKRCNLQKPEEDTYFFENNARISFTMMKKSGPPAVSFGSMKINCSIEDTTTNPAETTINSDTTATILSGTTVATDRSTETPPSSNGPTSELDLITKSGNPETNNLIKILVPVIILVVLAIVVVTSLIIYHKKKRSQNQTATQKEDKEVVENVIYSAAAPLANGSPEGVMVDNVIYGQNNYHVIDT